MRDPLLDEIWRVREELVKQHGGLDGFLRHIRYIQKLDRAHTHRQRRQQDKKTARRKLKASK